MAVDLGLLDAVPAPTVRRPRLTVTVDGDDDVLAGAVVAVVMDLRRAPAVDRCRVTIATSAPPVPVAAAAAVTADAGDGDPVPLFAGAVAAVRAGGRGTAVLDLVDASGLLAALRVERSYEQQSAGDIVRDLCGSAGVDVGDVAAGVRYPFVALDAGRTVWRHVARLAAHAGLVAGVDGDGAVGLAAPAASDIAAEFTHGRDVVALAVTANRPAPRPGIVGEGAAGSAGADAWAWLVRDPEPVRADLDGPPRADPALRTPEAVTTAAEAASARPHDRLHVTGPLTPVVRPGGGIQVRDVPAAVAAARGTTLTGVAVTVRHVWAAATAPVTTVDAELPAGAGTLAGLAGGL